MSIEFNQYQDIFSINNKKVLVDYFFGKGELLDQCGEKEQIVECHSEKYDVDEEIYFRRVNEERNKDEYTIVVIPSYNCNMECEYCYEGHEKRESSYMSEKEGDKIIDFLLEQKYSCVNLVILGGEPIFGKNLDLLLSFVKKMDNFNLNFSVSCVSNGLEVTEHIEEIKKLNISHMQMTLDGGEFVHNRRKVSKQSEKNPFKEVCSSIEILLKNNIEVALRINIDSGNVTQIREIYKIIMENRWNDTDLFYAYIYPVTYSGNDKTKKYLSEREIFELVILELLTIPESEDVFKLDFHGISFIDTIIANDVFVPMTKFCASCSNQIVFDGNKKIYTCWWGANNPDFIIGTFDENEIYIESEKLAQWHRHSIETIKKCQRCKYKFICGGGCVFKAHEINGTINEGRCSDFYALIKIYLEYLFSINSLYERIMLVKHYMIKEFIRSNGELVISVEGSSMNPTVLDGEKVVISCYNYKPMVGDVVLYKAKGELKLHRIVDEKVSDVFSIKGDGEDYIEEIHAIDIFGKMTNCSIKNMYSGIISKTIGKLNIDMVIEKSELKEIRVHE